MNEATYFPTLPNLPVFTLSLSDSEHESTEAAETDDDSAPVGSTPEERRSDEEWQRVWAQIQVLCVPAGSPLVSETDSTTGEGKEQPAAFSVTWRLDNSCAEHGHHDYRDLWRHFLDTVHTEQVQALVVGPCWGQDGIMDLASATELLVAAKDRFPALRGLFIGDIEADESEISWLQTGDVTSVLEAFPLLEDLGIRGDDPSALRPVRHETLRSLRCESGGLAPATIQAVSESVFPALEHLELWLGVAQYGGTQDIADIAPLLSYSKFPVLRHLGLMNSEIQDDIAALIAASPVTAQLTSLSLAMGILTDTGAENLLAGQPLTHLTHLDLHHHFLSDTMMQRLKNTLEPHGVTLDLSEENDPHYWGRYVAVAE